MQQYVKTATTSTNDTVLVNLIKQVLSAPDIYVFGELLSVDHIQELSKKSGDPLQHHQLLEIFAYGTYSDYKAKQGVLPKLSEKQAKKLKQLTIATLASETHVIPYSRLLEALDISELRELEDLIIDAIYKDIVHGKLDHENKVFQVDESLGRDLRPQDLDNMLATLNSWQRQSEILLKTIEEKMVVAQNHQTETAEKKRDFEKKVEEVKGNIKILMENEITGIDPEQFLHGDFLMGANMMKGHGGGVNRMQQPNKGKPGKGRNT
uniref:PCI domain-containing protein n=1 Tax=Arcella intermedia TaxID=1963864 RepID=A0A6B2LE54_9EUKA